jgi:hypothetical protein
MKHGDKDHKDAWIKYVANKLGFENMPHDMLPQAETLYERGWTAPETIEHFLRYLKTGA